MVASSHKAFIFCLDGSFSLTFAFFECKNCLIMTTNLCASTPGWNSVAYSLFDPGPSGAISMTISGSCISSLTAFELIYLTFGKCLIKNAFSSTIPLFMTSWANEISPSHCEQTCNSEQCFLEQNSLLATATSSSVISLINATYKPSSTLYLDTSDKQEERCDTYRV